MMKKTDIERIAFQAFLFSLGFGVVLVAIVENI
jgi:hypothetical protein